jgi:predicted metal-dependent HD superfamily phosphohydrolase
VNQVKHIEQVAREILEALPGNLCYHHLGHTQEVVQSVQLIGRRSGLLAKEIEWATLAAWLHDIGYSRTYLGHEEVSAEMAGEILRTTDMPEAEIRIIQNGIRATRVGKSPENQMEAVLSDADLAYLAGPDFVEKSLSLRSEWERVLGRVFTNKSWWEINKRFLRNHKYHSHFGQQVLERRKKRRLKSILLQYPNTVGRTQKEMEKDLVSLKRA